MKALHAGTLFAVLTSTYAAAALAAPPTTTSCSISSTPSPAVIEAGASVQFTGSVGGKSPIEYEWDFSGGTPSSATTQSVTVSYPSAGNFVATLHGTNAKGKTCNTAATVTVTQAPPPPSNNPPGCAIDTPAADLTVDVGDTIEYTATVIDPDGDAVTIRWNFPGGSPSQSFNEDPGAVTYATPGSYLTSLNADDGKGGSCIEQTRTVTVRNPPPPPPPAPDVSINSTSRSVDLPPTGAVAEQPLSGLSGYQVLAINDLGMHCGDLDTRIASILPPFNLLHALAIRKGGEPELLGEADVDLFYSAAAHHPGQLGLTDTGDPALDNPPVLALDGSLYKTNFWDVVNRGAYDPFYPPSVTPLAGVVSDDTGLPVPDVERLYLGDGQLHATQQAMPGAANPYVLNEPQAFAEHIGNLPFFIGSAFPFGYVANDVNWFEAAGIPVTVADDFGRVNPYPLMRVQAKAATGNSLGLAPGTLLASVDTVVPISAEADCKGCHAAPADGGNGSATQPLVDANVAVQTSLDDPAEGNVPLGVSVEWASDINILRLHDLKHGTTLESTTDPATGTASSPVVCQRCHYTPALDLAQVGPLGPENDLANANGRDQLKQSTMSNVMHSHHGQFTELFPDMPPAIDAKGNRRSAMTTQDILAQTCYRCHPGNQTQCLRGAMANADLVCQDCHGNMNQVGNDFSRNVSPTRVGAFELAPDFYTNPATPRVPWANEPGCGSCHTGDANSNLAGGTDVLTNPTDTRGNPDGIRLLQAYRVGDGKATPIVPTNKRFAEPAVSQGRPADGNPKLYRVSTGHGGVFCEGCHGSTHAEWPNANPFANDNVTAHQLQGHSGTIAECSTCHVTSSLPSNTQAGPHGMHLVNDSRFWREAHRDAAKAQNGQPGGGTCGACHGADHRGTVLSRTPVTRNWSVESITRTVQAGDPVACDLCHSLEKSFGR